MSAAADSPPPSHKTVFSGPLRKKRKRKSWVKQQSNRELPFFLFFSFFFSFLKICFLLFETSDICSGCTTIERFPLGKNILHGGKSHCSPTKLHRKLLTGPFSYKSTSSTKQADIRLYQLFPQSQPGTCNLLIVFKLQ